MRNRSSLFLAMGLSLLASAAAAQPTLTRDCSGFWSRVTLALPVATRHVPNNDDFNNENFGLLADVAMNDQWSMVAGGFRNSYGRNTAVAGAAWHTLSTTVGALRVRSGGLLAIDLNGGYRRYNSADPLVAAFSVRLSSAEPDEGPLSRVGIQLTVIPPAPDNGSTAFNLAITYKLK